MPSQFDVVFVASTDKDLQLYAGAVLHQLSSADFHCLRPNLHGPQPEDVVAYCRQQVEKCDFFVLLAGYRRGWEPLGAEGPSITEIEYEWACKTGKPVFAWLTPETFPIPANLWECDGARRRQQAFRGRIGEAGRRVVSERGFDSAERLGFEVTIHLLKHQRSRQMIAQAPAPTALEDLAYQETLAQALAMIVPHDVSTITEASHHLRSATLKTVEDELLDKARAMREEGALDRAQWSVSGSASAKYYVVLGRLARTRSLAEAQRYFAIATEQNDELAEAWNELGRVNDELGQHAYALDCFRRVVRIGRELRDRKWVSTGLGNQAGAHYSLDELDSAEAHYRRALEIDEHDCRLAGMADHYSGLGLVLRKRNLPQQALEMFEKSRQIEEAIGRWDRVAVDYNNIGMIHRDAGEHVEADRMFLKAIEIDGNSGDLIGLAASICNLGYSASAQLDFAKARQFFWRSIELYEQVEAQSPSFAPRLGLIEALIELRDIEQALGKLEQAQHLAEGLQDADALARCWELRDRLEELGSAR